MIFARWAHNHARSLIFLLLVLALAGAMSSFTLPVALFPNVEFPRVEVSLDAGDRPAERMAVEVTYPIEEALRAIPGVRDVRSTTSRGSADISVNFDWGQDMVAAMLQAQSQVNRLLPTLPPGTTFDARRMDPTVFPVLAYSLTSDSHSLTEVRDLATYDLRPTLSTVTGVSRVDVQGGDIEEYRVVADLAKLQSFGLTISDVAASLSAANVLTAVGHLEDRDKLYLVISNTRFQTMQQIGATILRTGASGDVVRLSDVASVQQSTVPQFTRVTADGHDAVLMQVFQQPGGNTVQIAKGIKATLDEASKRIGILKDGTVKVANWYDQSDLILASESSVRDAVLIGAVLAVFVLLLFLRNFKITLIATLAVPLVLAATILMLSVLNMSFNIMTLGGMAAAVGLIIDDAIVMVEQIARRLRSGSGDPATKVLQATAEFTRPLFGSSASTIIIFAPLAFLSGVTGAFFKALSLTMATSLAISFAVAYFAIPVVAAHWLGPKDAEPEKEGRLGHAIHRTYGAILSPLLRYPWLVLLLILPILAVGYFAYNRVGSGFMPSMDEGGFILDYVAPAGTSLTETDRLLRQVEAILRQTPEVQTYSRRTGLALGGTFSEANSGDFFIRLKPLPRRDIKLIMDDVAGQVQQHVPGLTIETAQLMEDLIGDLTSQPQPIVVKIFSDDDKVLNDLGPKVADALSKAGVQEVKSGIVLAGDALNIDVDRVKAALEGIGPDDVTKAVNDYLSGNVTTQILVGPKVVGVRVWIPRSARRTDLDVAELPIRAPNGHVFPLKRIAQFTVITGQPEINRENLRRMIAVTGRTPNGRDLGSTVVDVKNALATPGLLPPGIGYELGGLYQQQQIAFQGLLIVIIAAIALVFLLLLVMYESFRVAIAMLATTMLAMSTVFLGLWLTSTELNITSIMGMTMVVGIVTEVAIFYFSEYTDLSSGEAGEVAGFAAHQPATAHPLPDYKWRLITAGILRMRAIAMTTIAAILALMPLALGIGQGSAMQQPLAIAIISGLIAQLPLVLIILPSLLCLLGFVPKTRHTTDPTAAV